MLSTPRMPTLAIISLVLDAHGLIVPDLGPMKKSGKFAGSFEFNNSDNFA